MWYKHILLISKLLLYLKIMVKHIRTYRTCVQKFTHKKKLKKTNTKTSYPKCTIFSFPNIKTWEKHQHKIVVIYSKFITIMQPKEIRGIAWKASKYRVFSSPYFHVFSPNSGKYEPDKAPYLGPFHAVRQI